MNVPDVMKWANFGASAPYYKDRPGYARSVVDCVARYVGARPRPFAVADIGAGTGVFTRLLLNMGLSGYAIEPDDGMRAEAAEISGTAGEFTWIKGTAEESTLPAASVDWVCVSTSFHLMVPRRALREFARILKPGGYLTIIWKLRDIEHDPLMNRVETLIDTTAPNLSRLYRQALDSVGALEANLDAAGAFSDFIHVDAPHIEHMSRGSYLNIWRSSEEIPSQVGPERWRSLVAAIEAEVPPLETVEARLRTHAWTAQRADAASASARP